LVRQSRHRPGMIRPLSCYRGHDSAFAGIERL
jgi:hypothetical protein